MVTKGLGQCQHNGTVREQRPGHMRLCSRFAIHGPSHVQVQLSNAAGLREFLSQGGLGEAKLDVDKGRGVFGLMKSRTDRSAEECKSTSLSRSHLASSRRFISQPISPSGDCLSLIYTNTNVYARAMPSAMSAHLSSPLMQRLRNVFLPILVIFTSNENSSQPFVLHLLKLVDVFFGVSQLT